MTSKVTVTIEHDGVYCGVCRLYRDQTESCSLFNVGLTREYLDNVAGDYLRCTACLEQAEEQQK